MEENLDPGTWWPADAANVFDTVGLRGRGDGGGEYPRLIGRGLVRRLRRIGLSTVDTLAEAGFVLAFPVEFDATAMFF